MRRLDDEHGGVAVTVAILLVVLIGLGALVVDVGNLYWERRQLQNAADSAALAAAQDHIAGQAALAETTARNFALANNTRGAFVEDIYQPNPNSVTVETITGDIDAPGSLSSFLAGVLGVEDYFAHASATAVWGAPDAATADLPLTISMCDIKAALGLEDLGPGDDISHLLDSDPTTIIFHNSQSPHDECSAQPGFDANEDGKLPAGFGWLHEDEVDDCQIEIANTTEDGFYWAFKDPGNNPIRHCLEAALGKAVVIPVFIDFKRDNPRDQYLLWAPAAFHLEGYRFPGMNAGNPGCSAPQTCIRGYFTSKLESGAGTGGETGLGVTSIRLSE